MTWTPLYSRTPQGIVHSASCSAVSGPGRGASNLAVRVATAAVGIPIVLAVNYLGGWVFASAIGVVAALSTVELYSLFRKVDFAPALLLGVPAAMAFAVLPALMRGTDEGWVALLVALLVVTGAYFLAPGSDRKRLLDWCLTIMGSLYVGLLLGQLTLLRGWTHGAWWVVLVFLATWAYDTGAFFSGRLFGSRPFMHHISPNKTVEGVQGGLLLSSLAGLAGVPAIGLSPWQGILLGLVVGVAAQVGDLVESMIKRQTGAKDSGTIIPGHGGLLDRIDSLLFTATVTVYVARVFGYGP
jgi:phosphatidate cytidylyltransferase